ncbi:transcription termination factor MTERF6, chloroplastic/mitochondrial [Dioscorea cayenensis subsp. rotundata]|uniref:Transcription termination factor MTERF6, chloroplastic/mitochondrial n=1 Tax=Dioscorea cayennensis subsp. rotundata TaxID=55577 RepID=A0AB40D148_DIOCR|nr:transcription termination factor MTERF6, chloroplastic/mitochondrial [Dioscorea cayenensis subsp. rotundata]
MLANRLLQRTPGRKAISALLSVSGSGSLFSYSSTDVSVALAIDTSLEQSLARHAADVFRVWGCCTDAEVSQILARHPSISRIRLTSLQSKLQVLRRIGIIGPDLVKVINCRPRFLARRIGGPALDARLDFLRTLFRSDDDLLRALVRNPSLLSYDVEAAIKPCVQLYQAMGVGRYQLGRLLISRPTIILRSRLDDEKLDLLRRTGLPRDATMYKYALCLIAISRLDTLRSKIANLERFGFTINEVMGLFARTPNVLSLSVDKVQRNMTYVVGVMKLSPHVVLKEPAFLYSNLEKVLRPRYLLGLKLQEMDLRPQFLGPSLIRAIGMKEPRFLKQFITCHGKDVATPLLDFYSRVKSLPRLAETSRSTSSVMRKGIPI